MHFLESSKVCSWPIAAYAIAMILIIFGAFGTLFLMRVPPRKRVHFFCFAKRNRTKEKATRAKSAPRCPCFVVSQTIKPFVSLLAALFAAREFKPQTDHRGIYMPWCCSEEQYDCCLD
jgi:hypothetical protein